MAWRLPSRITKPKVAMPSFRSFSSTFLFSIKMNKRVASKSSSGRQGLASSGNWRPRCSALRLQKEANKGGL